MAGGDLGFIRVVVKSKCHRLVKQERSTEVKGMCRAVIIVIDCGIYLSCAKEVLINGNGSVLRNIS